MSSVSNYIQSLQLHIFPGWSIAFCFFPFHSITFRPCLSESRARSYIFDSVFRTNHSQDTFRQIHSLSPPPPHLLLIVISSSCLIVMFSSFETKKRRTALLVFDTNHWDEAAGRGMLMLMKRNPSVSFLVCVQACVLRGKSGS